MGNLCSTNQSTGAEQSYKENPDNSLLKAKDKNDELRDEIKSLIKSCRERFVASDVIIDNMTRGLDTIIDSQQKHREEMDEFRAQHNEFRIQHQVDIDGVRAHNRLLEQYLEILMADNPRAIEFVEKFSTLFK